MTAAGPRAAAAMLVAGVAAVAGLMWPDADLYIPGLVHRSGLTHSLLLPLVLLAVLRRSWGGLAVAGLALGIAVHLAADCFPQALRGYALVKLPLLRPGRVGSEFWLIVNAVGAVALGLELIDRIEGEIAAWVAAAAVVVLAVAYFVLHREPYWMLPGAGVALAVAHGPMRRAAVARIRTRNAVP